VTNRELQSILLHVATAAIDARRAEREMRRWPCEIPDEILGTCGHCRNCVERKPVKRDRDLARKRMRRWADKALDEYCGA
jgi:hypothetical protein